MLTAVGNAHASSKRELEAGDVLEARASQEYKSTTGKCEKSCHGKAYNAKVCYDGSACSGPAHAMQRYDVGRKSMA